jgi:hypothetical protein
MAWSMSLNEITLLCLIVFSSFYIFDEIRRWLCSPP